MKNKILLASPHMGGKELDYIHDAFEKNWIAPLGENVNEFENDIKSYAGCKEALALSSGSAAIHLGLLALGVKKGDYVFCSTLTFSASCNPIMYLGAIPVFIDSDEDSWNMSPSALEKAFQWAKKENKLPKVVIVVDLYGQSAKYDEIIPICKKYNVPILEDAAEALGTTYQGKVCGTFGDIGIYSFNGNKIITTSGGGMLVCDDKAIRDKCFFWATQSREPEIYYQHKEVGYNYRMSNICAGIGRGQMQVLNKRIQQKKDIYYRYKNAFEKNDFITMMPKMTDSDTTFWLSCMLIHKQEKSPFELVKYLSERNIEARPVWKPMHLQPIFQEYPYFSAFENSVADQLFAEGICLPSDTKMSKEEQDLVIQHVLEYLAL